MAKFDLYAIAETMYKLLAESDLLYFWFCLLGIVLSLVILEFIIITFRLKKPLTKAMNIIAGRNQSWQTKRK